MSKADFSGEIGSLLHLDAFVRPVILENDVDGFDNFLAWIGLTMDDDFVFKRFGAVNLHHVLLGEAVVPTAVPSGQMVRIFLKRVRQLSAGQLLNIKIAVAVGVGLEFDLSNGWSRKSDTRATQNQFLYDHWIFSFAIRFNSQVPTNQLTGELP
jgi:hypothetical protein